MTASLLYLDSFDLDPDNPTPSAIHHVLELLAARPLLGPGTVVVVDDYGVGGDGCKFDADAVAWPHIAFSTGRAWGDLARRYHETVEAQLAGANLERTAQELEGSACRSCARIRGRHAKPAYP